MVTDDLHIIEALRSPDLCRKVSTRLLSFLRAELEFYGEVDTELARWARSVDRRGWSATDADASFRDRPLVVRPPWVRAEQLTTEEAAEELSMSESGVRDAVREGRITASRRGRILLVDRAEVDRYRADPRRRRRQPA